jgi:hypothetical protein
MAVNAGLESGGFWAPGAANLFPTGEWSTAQPWRRVASVLASMKETRFSCDQDDVVMLSRPRITITGGNSTSCQTVVASLLTHWAAVVRETPRIRATAAFETFAANRGADQRKSNRREVRGAAFMPLERDAFALGASLLSRGERQYLKCRDRQAAIWTVTGG